MTKVDTKMNIESLISESYGEIKSLPGVLFQDAVHSLTKERVNDLFQDLRTQLRQAEKKQDSLLIAWAYLRMGMVYRGQRKYASAITVLHRAQAGFEAADDPTGLAVLFEELACVNRELNRNALALDYSQKAVERYQQLERPLELGWVYDNMSVIYLNMARRQEGMAFAKKAREIFLEHNNPSCLAWNACNLGNLHYDMGLYAEAKPYYEEALRTFESLGIKQGIAWSLLWLGMLARSRTDFASAEPYLLKAKAAFMELDMHDRAGWAVLNLAGVRWAQGRNNEATALNKSAIKLFKPLHNNDGVAWGTFQQAQILRDQGRLTAAWQLLRQALNLYSHIASQKGTAWAECELGEIYFLLADEAHARECFLKARNFADRLSLLPLKAEVEKNYSAVLTDGGLIREAIDSLKTAEEICEKIHSMEILGDVLFAQARAAIVAKDYTTAKETLKKVSKIIDQHGLGRLKSALSIYEGECLLAEGHVDEAARMFTHGMAQSKAMDQKISWVQAALGLLQTGKHKKPTASQKRQFKEMEKALRLSGSRRLKAKLLVMEAIMNLTSDGMLDNRLFQQSLDILDDGELLMLKKQFLELFVFLLNRAGRKEEAAAYEKERLEILNKRADLVALAPRAELFERFPISVVA